MGRAATGQKSLRRVAWVPGRSGHAGTTGSAAGPADAPDEPGAAARRDPRRRPKGGAVLRERAGVVACAVDVRDDGGSGADEQPRGTAAASSGAVAQAEFRVLECERLSLRGADPDRGTNPAVAGEECLGLPA